MNIRFRRTTGMLSLSALTLLVAAVTTVHAANPRSVSLTIQENGAVRVSETHDVPPPRADGLLAIAPLPDTLLPSSVGVIPAERGASFAPASQRFAYDLADDRALFNAYRGLHVTCLKDETSFSGILTGLPDFSAAAPSITLHEGAAAAPAMAVQPKSSTVRFIPDLRALDAVEFPARTDFSATPTLLWQLPSDQSPPSAVLLNYAATDITWDASHDAILSADGHSIALSSRVHLHNGTVRDFNNAQIRLALTEKGIFTPLIPALSDPRATAPVPLRFSDDGRQLVPERTAASFAIVATYDLPATLSLPALSDVYATLTSLPNLSAETTLVYDGVRFDRFQRNPRTDPAYGAASSSIVETRLTFRNEGKISLPPGPFRVLRGAPDVPMEWVGSDWLPALPPGASATLKLGPASGFHARRVRTAFTETDPLRNAEESFEITVENQSPFPRTVDVIEHLYRGPRHDITAASADFSPGPTPDTLRIPLTVPAGASSTFSYTVRYTW